MSDRHCKDITISGRFQRFSPNFLRMVATRGAICDKKDRGDRSLISQEKREVKRIRFRKLTNDDLDHDGKPSAILTIFVV